MTEQSVSNSGRSIWVWIIAIWFIFGAFMTYVPGYLIDTGAIPVDASEKAKLDALKEVMTPFDHLAMAFFAIVPVLGGIALFFMRRVAYPILLGEFLLGLCYRVWGYISGQYPGMSIWDVVASNWIAVILSMLIVAYVRYLYREGRLR